MRSRLATRILALAALVLLLVPSAPRAQEALSPLEAATVQLERDRPPFRRLVDFDLDGDLDAIGYHHSIAGTLRHFEVAAYENDGSGRFTEVWSYVQTAAVYGIDYTLLGEVGFLNDDPYPDIMIMYRGYRFDYTGSGDGQFQFTYAEQAPTMGISMAVEDLDGDGIDDWLWNGSWYDLLQYRTLTLRTSLGFEEEVTHGVSEARSLHVLRPDATASDFTFLVVGATQLRTFRYTPGGGIVMQPPVTHGMTNPMCDTGDVDGDGDVDAVLFLAGDPATYRVLRRTGPYTWDYASEPLVAGGPAEFLLDVDGDGDLDGACCGGGGEAPVFGEHVQPSDFQISINQGGVFAPAFRIPGLGSTQLAGVADVDGDGDRDLVAGRCVVFARGVVEAPRSYAPAFVPPRSRRALADPDGDGDLDVGFSLHALHRNDGTGHFTLAVPVVPRPGPGFLYRGPGFPGDFDGDGDTDLLVELRFAKRRHLGEDEPPLGMVLLANDGSGALSGAGLASAPGQTLALDGLQAEASLTIDADLDGDLDLIVSSTGPATRSARWNNDGTGRFAHAGTWIGRRCEWAGDVDLDGDMDLVMSAPDASGLGSFLELYLGPSPGYVLDTRFQLLAFEPRYGDLAPADLLVDGLPDFVLARTTLDGTSGVVLRNDFAIGGSLSVVAGIGASSLASSARAVAGDLSGDGIDDVLIGPHDEPVPVSDLYRSRDGGGVNPGDFDLARQLVPPGLLVDIDGDGDLDLLGQRVVFNLRVP